MGDCSTLNYLFPVPTELWPLITTPAMLAHSIHEMQIPLVTKKPTDKFYEVCNSHAQRLLELLCSFLELHKNHVTLLIHQCNLHTTLGKISSSDMSFTVHASFLMEIINLNLIHTESTQSSVALFSSFKWKCFAHLQNSHKKLYQVSNKRYFQMCEKNIF